MITPAYQQLTQRSMFDAITHAASILWFIFTDPSYNNDWLHAYVVDQSLGKAKTVFCCYYKDSYELEYGLLSLKCAVGVRFEKGLYLDDPREVTP